MSFRGVSIDDRSFFVMMMDKARKGEKTSYLSIRREASQSAAEVERRSAHIISVSSECTADGR